MIFTEINQCYSDFWNFSPCKCSICIISILDFFLNLVEINYHMNVCTYTTYFTSWFKSFTTAVNFKTYSMENVNVYWYLRLAYTAVSMFWYVQCGITSASMKKWACLCTGHGMKVNITTSICWCPFGLYTSLPEATCFMNTIL